MKFSKIYEKSPKNLSNIEISGVYCDSRRVTKNSVFVCIVGSAMDGHNFAAAAAQNGACAIFCERDLGLQNQIIVEDTKAVYAELCANFFDNPAKKIKLIGVTGTSGKTSVTYMTKSLLDRCGKKTGLIGTIQNIIGDEILPAKNTTPDAYELHSLLSLMHKAGCEYAVMEVSSHALDQKRVHGLTFDCAVFTNLSQDHLDYHGTMENYFHAKARLFTMCRTAIINIDCEYGKRLVDMCECPVKTFSAKRNDSDFTANGIYFSATAVEYELVTDSNIGRVKVNTPGIFTVYNSMSAGIIGRCLGIDFKDVVKGLHSVQGVKGRVEIVPTEQDFSLIIDYAHTPDELENVCDMLNQLKKGRLVTVFGCGGDRDRTKRPLMGEVASSLSDFVIVTSDNPRSEEPGEIIKDILEGIKSKKPCEVIENRAEAIEFAIKNARADDIILFAGKGHETYQVLKDETIHFDEREVIRGVLESL